jgi:hypothetical protein
MILTANMSLRTPTQTSPTKCTTYILSKQVTGEYNAHDIANVIVPAYFAIAMLADLNPELLIAQMMHETGSMNSWWCARPRRNPAGIGVTGRTEPASPPRPPESWALHPDGTLHEGVSFEAWKDDSIPAHIGRVLAYCCTDAELTDKQKALVEKALTYRPLPPTYRGIAPIAMYLGAADNPINQGEPRSKWKGWAVPGRGYGEKLTAIANAIIRL